MSTMLLSSDTWGAPAAPGDKAAVCAGASGTWPWPGPSHPLVCSLRCFPGTPATFLPHHVPTRCLPCPGPTACPHSGRPPRTAWPEVARGGRGGQVLPPVTSAAPPPGSDTANARETRGARPGEAITPRPGHSARDRHRGGSTPGDSNRGRDTARPFGHKLSRTREPDAPGWGRADADGPAAALPVSSGPTASGGTRGDS